MSGYRRAGRAILPIGGRLKRGREPITLCAATNLTPVSLSLLDRRAGELGECRSEFIRKAIEERMARTGRS